MDDPLSPESAQAASDHERKLREASMAARKLEGARQRSFFVWMMLYVKCSDRVVAIRKQALVVQVPNTGDRVYLDGGLPKLVSLGIAWHELDGEWIPVVMLKVEDEQDESELQQWTDRGWQIGEAREMF